MRALQMRSKRLYFYVYRCMVLYNSLLYRFRCDLRHYTQPGMGVYPQRLEDCLVSN